MVRAPDNPWLCRFATLTAVATLFLLCVGGLVTSHGAGLSVPDWPNTYGYNMFFFPISKWIGGVFYEHSHRLAASGVGLLTTILAVWLWLKDSRRWMRVLGVVAFFGVVLQGVLGGLRVTLLKDELGIFHAALAQLFFVLICAIALFCSRTWRRLCAGSISRAGESGIRKLLLATTLLIFVQLVLGATMRHQHAGLAIPDFPLAYGRLWPATDDASVATYNQERMEAVAYRPITAFQIELQMVHRIVAVCILALVVWTAVRALRRLGKRHILFRLSAFWLGVIVIQAGLGAATILTNKSADIATAHVVVGALSLSLGALSWIIASQCLGSSERLVRQVPSTDMEVMSSVRPTLANSRSMTR